LRRSLIAGGAAAGDPGIVAGLVGGARPTPRGAAWSSVKRLADPSRIVDWSAAGLSEAIGRLEVQVAGPSLDDPGVLDFAYARECRASFVENRPSSRIAP
jgi:hypothetical protein